MNRIEAFQILGIAAVKDERAIRNAYREKLNVTNPEDDPEGFKRLRGAYEEACRYAKEPEEAAGEEKPEDTTVSGLWLQKAVKIYGNIRTRQDAELWKKLFDDDAFLSLEEEENCRHKLLSFLTQHYKLPTQIWKLLDKKLNITEDAKALREKFPANFMHYIVSKCERGEDLMFGQFEGAEDADYDLFLEYYDRCWQALQSEKPEEARICLESADKLGIRHPVMEVCRANLLLKEGRREESIALLEEQLEKYPGDAMISYNFAEMLWNLEGEKAGEGGDGQYRERAAELYQGLKAENDTHYMANLRLTNWYFGKGQFRDAKKCAEKVLAYGSDDAFMELLVKINGQLERELEERYAQTGKWEPALELCWCYLQDGRTVKGLQLARKLEKLLPPEKEAEYHGLMAKLYVEQAEYEKSIEMTRRWEISLKAKMQRKAEEGKGETEKDRDRLRQAHLIRMQCYHNLGFADEEKFELAVDEAKCILGDGMACSGTKDIGICLDLAQIYMEMEEYEKSLEIAQMLVEEQQVFAAYASSLEVYRRQLDAGGVVRAASQCIRYFPGFVKSYEYLAKVYLDLGRHEDLAKVLEDADKNGARSVILEAYRFQMEHKAMEIRVLNGKLKSFRQDYLKHAENGEPGYYEKGLPILTEYLYHYPDDFMLVERAIFHRAAHHFQEAREDFEKALYMNPSNPYALNGLGSVHKYLGEYERALFFIKKAILYLDKEMSPIIYADLGNLYALLGDAESALEAYDRYRSQVGAAAGRIFSDNLAECNLRTGRIAEAAAVYEGFYRKNKWERYKKLTELYGAAGMETETRRVLSSWKRELREAGGLHRFPFFPEKSGDKVSPLQYFNRKGWAELLFGSRRDAVRAFAGMLRGEKNIDAGLLSDAVFACILCGDDRRGKRYAEKLRRRLEQDGAEGIRRYYNAQKSRLQMEFLASYYTETPQKLREILDREENCSICYSCICPLCKEMEGAGILFLLRTGHREEAEERLRRNLEVQPWDEYMLAIKHTVFGEDVVL